jgi:hypothetical protein
MVLAGTQQTMLTINLSEAGKHLNSIIKGNIKTSVMIWGAPGIGKSSIVNRVAKDNEMGVIDLRLSQLAPTDIRGLPYVEDGIAKFAPPNFLPRSGAGILFLDEVNLAPPAIQNVAMQLVLDRRVGDYVLPDEWFVVAAGNRVEDRAAVSQMPAPLANRFIHFTVEADLTSWKEYALTTGVKEEIISFLNFRPNLLHSFNKNAIAWPSPRSWDFASDLMKIGLPVDCAVGEGAAAEFKSFVKLYSKLPDVEKVLAGDKSIKMPKEPSVLFAITGALVGRSETADNFFNGMMWLVNAATEDYVGVYMSDALVRMKSLGVQGAFVSKVTKSPEAKKFVSRYQELLR